MTDNYSGASGRYPRTPTAPAEEPNPFAPPAQASPPATATASTVDGTVEASPVERAGEVIERAAAASSRVASQLVDRLRNDAELTADRGITSISDEVVEKIAGIAARQVPGVHDLGGDVARAFASLRERIGLGDAGDDTDRGISVRLDGERARINVTLVIEYGHVVRDVTTQVRADVITAVETMLSLDVTDVNIVVDDIHVPDASA